MVRNYKKKSNRRYWSEDVLIAAMHSVLEEHSSVNAASTEHGIPEATLRRYIKKQNNNDPLPISGGRFRKTFSDAQAKELVTYIKDLSLRAFGLTSMECRKLAYEFAELSGINHQFCRATKLAGKDWLKYFMDRHRISLRTPESTSLGRLMGFNKVEVTRFFDILRDIRLKYNFTVDCIYNADESGLSTVPNKKPKILSPTGTRRVCKVASGERGKNTTVVCAMNAQGTYVPPFFIFGRVRMRPELLNGCPPNSDGIAQPSGWMNTESFVLYLKHFVKFVRPSKEAPVLLIVDNHSSHTSLEAINFCRDNGVVMIGLPPHSTHRLQPLDVGFFGPLKTFYSQACDNYLVNHPGKPITDKEVGELFGKAFLKAASVGTAVKSFSTCGIEPYNPDVFREDDFAPSMLSERHITAEDDSSSSDNEPLANIKSKLERKSMTSALPGPSGIKIINNELKIQKEPLDITTKHQETPSSSSIQKHVEKNEQDLPISVEISRSIRNTDDDGHISLIHIRPLPKYNRPVKSTKRVKQRASVITSTPNKEEQEKKNIEKIEKENKKRKIDVSKVKKKIGLQEFNGKQPQTKEKGDIFCPGCQEPFNEPPTEDWIQCRACESWWHESCTAYEKKGSFTCDLCL